VSVRKPCEPLVSHTGGENLNRNVSEWAIHSSSADQPPLCNKCELREAESQLREEGQQLSGDRPNIALVMTNAATLFLINTLS
jgi:hypothetical protein